MPKRRLTRFRPEEWKGRRAAVLGLGRSGLHCANLLVRRGVRVLASDLRAKKDLELRGLDKRVRVETGGHGGSVFQCDFAVKSPGMSPRAPALKKLAERGIPVFSEVEAALGCCRPHRLWAVTGTNGKSTTSALLGEILRSAGRRTHVAGNIGLPIAQTVQSVRPDDEIVAELSSYQLEDSRWIRPRVGAILNFTPDHLEHHGSMAAYGRAKARLFRDQGPTDVLVYNGDDRRVRRLVRECPSRTLTFGTGREADARIGPGRIEVRRGGKTHVLIPPVLLGGHNLENAAAAALMAASQRIPFHAIQKAFDAFKGIEHRLETAGVVSGVQCINDSKATNVDSTRVALKAFLDIGPRLLLILGGRHKGASYRPLAPLIRRTTRVLLTIGEAAPRVARDLRRAAPILSCATLAQAVRKGLSLARPGDILLLSPACSSFDQFPNFEERGKAFKRLVRRKAR